VAFVTASEAARGRLSTQTFIAYSTKDTDFAHRLNNALQDVGKTTWFDHEGIAAEEDFEAELRQGINDADNTLFVLSPDAAASETYKTVAEYAHRQGKRMFALLSRDTEANALPEVLRALNPIDFRKPSSFSQQIQQLIQAIDIDYGYTRRHTELLQRANAWQEHGNSADFLLNSSACEKAEIWWAEAVEHNRQPAPTAMQQDFIQQSRQAIRKANRRRNMMMAFVSVLALVAVGLGFFSWLQMQQAETEKNNTKVALQKADEALKEAEAQQQQALLNQSRFLADKARQLTEKGKVFSAMRAALEALPETAETHPQRPMLQEAAHQLYNAVEQHYRGILEHDGSVGQAVFSPDGKRLLSRAGNAAYLWDAASLKIMHVLTGHEEDVTHVAFSPDGETLLTASADNTARLWNATDGTLLHVLTGHEASVNRAAFSPDGKTLLTASADNTAKLWNAADGTVLHVLKGHEYNVTHAAFSPDGKTLLTASDDNTARLWNAADGTLLHVLKGHEAGVSYAAFSPDGKTLLTASYDKTARLWNTADGALLHVLTGHEGSIYHVAFSPDGKTLLTASEDKTARLWNAADGELLHVLAGHENAVGHAVFSPDGKTLLTASYDKTARLWPFFANNQQLIARANALLPRRKLSCAERKTTYFLDFVSRCAKVADENIRGNAYQGEIQDETAHGQGESQGRNHYKGGFDKGMKHGRGIYTWADGTVYQGEFAQDEAVGIGALKASAEGWYREAKQSQDPQQALALLETQLKIIPQHVLSFLLWGEVLVKQEKLQEAQEKFQQALALDASLNLDPASKVRQVRAEVLVGEVFASAKQGEIDQALAHIQQARQLDAEVEILAYIWGYLCWVGAIHKQASKVLDACEQAVALSDGDFDYRDSRGLARALTHCH